MRSELVGLAAGVALLAGCGGSTSPGYGGGGGGGGGGCTPTATTVCLTTGNAFNPVNLTITAGQTVTWNNGSSTTHTVTSSSSSTQAFNSGNLAGSAMFTHTFPAAGTFHYYCQIHGADGTPPTGMAGTIAVQ